MENRRTYLAIDAKSFFSSVECVERGLNPLTTNLVVADMSRTEKTICLAITPSLKAYGLGGRARLFEVVQRVREVNNERRNHLPNYRFTGKSCFATELEAHPDWELDYIVAMPRMALYIKYSTRIYETYLKYIAPEDIHTYSIDEVFIDVTKYLATYKMTAHELAMTLIRDVLKTTGITATAGIGSNMYLAKIAMDIVAKHIPADKDGVRIAELDEMTYRRQLWSHRPLTSFWRVGTGIAEKLAVYGIDTMGKIARCSIENEELLYRLFGVNAELLIDHAWGWEPCTIDAIKAYKPESSSLGSGQVLTCPYDIKKARVVILEMADSLSLDLVDKGMVTDQLVINVGYDIESLSGNTFHGKITIDRYGRDVPKQSHGSINMKTYTSSSRQIMQAAGELFDRIANPTLLVRRLNITANHVVKENEVKKQEPVQLDFFTDYEQEKKKKRDSEEEQAKERNLQEAIIDLKKKFGKNAILRGLNFQEGATAMERNQQIGGHKA